MKGTIRLTLKKCFFEKKILSKRGKILLNNIMREHVKVEKKNARVNSSPGKTVIFYILSGALDEYCLLSTGSCPSICLFSPATLENVGTIITKCIDF